MSEDGGGSSEFFDDIWTVYFHDPDNADWNLGSYHALHTVSSTDDFWTVDAALHHKVAQGMFFLMREHVFPCYDDASNRNGGCFSLRVPKADAPRFWQQLAMRAVGETLTSSGAARRALNGISISPKRQFCVVKIWTADATSMRPTDLKLPSGYVGSVLFRSWWAAAASGEPATDDDIRKPARPPGARS